MAARLRVKPMGFAFPRRSGAEMAPPSVNALIVTVVA
jgi:hypothetical protein